MLTMLKSACAVIALAAALGATAHAQTTQTASGEPVYLEADSVVEDRQAATVTARGSVRMRAGARILHADELVYDRQTGRVVARGAVEFYDGDEPAQLAEEIELDEDLREGVASGFSTLLENNGKAAAATAVRREDGSVTLSDAYYTACDLCEDGTGNPTWRLRAERVVRSTDDDMIYYRNARLEILGAPVLYSPVFAHPDPSAERKSGFLMPRVDVSDRLGLSYAQPYLWVISPYQDLSIAPRLMTEVNPGVELDYRRRFHSGSLSLEGSATYEQEFDSDGFFGEEEFRWHAFADGLFDINETWRWGFGVQATSGDLYLRRYDYNEQPDETGRLLEADRRQLISQLFIQGRSERFYADVATARLQSLISSVNDDTIPLIAPLAEFRYGFNTPREFGRVSTTLSTAVLNREDGDDYARVSAGLNWERPTILTGGVRVEPFAEARADAYWTEDDATSTENDVSRFLGLGGVDVSWPFIRPTDWGSTILAPRLQLSSATGLDADEIPQNEDSLATELNRSVLMDRVRAAGYDIWEDGTRLDAGLTAAVAQRALGGIEAEAFIGRSWRLDGDAVFGPGSGLDEDESDWIADIEVNFGALDVMARSRLDSADGGLNRLDAAARLDAWRVTAGLRYTFFDDTEIARAVTEQLSGQFEYAVNKRWAVGYTFLRDIDDDITRREELALIYRDECTDMRIIYQREDFQIGDLGPNESIKFRLTLYTLGALNED
ncbi:MAG: LPS assembly protein LptD [Pseudomonadota bacterium]